MSTGIRAELVAYSNGGPVQGPTFASGTGLPEVWRPIEASGKEAGRQPDDRPRARDSLLPARQGFIVTRLFLKVIVKLSLILKNPGLYLLNQEFDIIFGK
jgi:hypothetical protein